MVQLCQGDAGSGRTAGRGEKGGQAADLKLWGGVDTRNLWFGSSGGKARQLNSTGV